VVWGHARIDNGPGDQCPDAIVNLMRPEGTSRASVSLPKPLLSTPGVERGVRPRIAPAKQKSAHATSVALSVALAAAGTPKGRGSTRRERAEDFGKSSGHHGRLAKLYVDLV